MSNSEQGATSADRREDRGIVYVATGAPFLDEAIVSARASRLHASATPIAVYTDCPDEATSAGCFEHVLEHPDPRRCYRDKIPVLLELPFACTLFLDTDARLTADCDGLFALSERFDLAAAHAPVRRPRGWSAPEVPAVFPELNSGVLLLRRSDLQRTLVERWLTLYDEVGQEADQASLRVAVWETLLDGLQLYVLPPEANLRPVMPWVTGRELPVMVLHGRFAEDETERLVRYLNDNVGQFRSGADWHRRNLPRFARIPRVFQRLLDRVPGSSGGF